MITEETLKQMESNTNFIHTVWDKYGNSHNIIKYNYPMSEEFLEKIKPYMKKCEEYTDSFGEICLKIDDRIFLFDGDYFDITNKDNISDETLLNNYDTIPPSERDIYENKIKLKDDLINYHLENLESKMSSSIDSVDEDLYVYCYTLNENKHPKYKTDILKITDEISNYIDKIQEKLEQMEYIRRKN